jgi:NAD(P)-dependent dehydrogenase (short-subunit alcohol dehydrogenase family)
MRDGIDEIGALLGLSDIVQIFQSGWSEATAFNRPAGFAVVRPAHDVLVNNAATAVRGKRVDDPELNADDLDRQWAINVLATVATTRAAARRNLSDGGGIIFIDSALGSHAAFPGRGGLRRHQGSNRWVCEGIGRDLGARLTAIATIRGEAYRPAPAQVSRIPKPFDTANRWCEWHEEHNLDT